MRITSSTDGNEAVVVVAFVADVTRVDAAGRARERDHLFGLREPARLVEQAARQAEGAIGHALFHQGDHPLEFCRGWFAPLLIPQHRAANARVADEQRHVHADTAVGLDRRELPLQIGAAATVGVADDGRDALREQRPAVTKFGPCQTLERMRVNVEEARRHHAILRVHDGGRCGAGQRADGDDAIAADADVRPPPRVARPIEHPPVLDQDVERLLGGVLDGCGREASGRPEQNRSRMTAKTMRRMRPILSGLGASRKSNNLSTYRPV